MRFTEQMEWNVKRGETMAQYTLTAKLTADAKEFVSGINKAKGEMTGLEKFSKNIGTKIQGFGKSIGRIGDQLTNKITKPALIAGAAVGGITLAKGFQRLVGIDTARAKLSALGHDAKSVDGIMVSALDSVKGTSYGLEEAATAAASAVAAGIEPGKDLTRYLSLATDVAAIAGTEFNEMADIFGKVQTSGKLSRLELDMLTSRGVPMLEYLEEATGKSGDALQKMISNGAIDSEIFLKAVETNIGGAAKVMGEKSFTAGIANMWAAVGRLGASFLDAGGKGGGFFSTIKPMIADFTDNIDKMGDIAERSGVKFGEMFTSFIEKIQEVKAWYDDLSPTIQSIINKTMLWGSIGLVAIGPILKMVAPIVQLFGFLASSIIPIVIGAFKLLGPVISFLVGPVGLIITAIALLTAGFIYLYNTSETFRDIIHSVFEAVQTVIMEVIGVVTEFIMEVWGGIVEWWQENNEAILMVTEAIWSFITSAIEIALDVIMAVFSFVWPFVQMLIVDTWNAIKNTIQGGIDVILNIISLFANLFTGNWSGVWDSAKGILSGAVQALWGLVNLWFIGKILKVGKTFFNLFKGVFTSGWNFIKSLFSRTISSISGNVTRGFNAIKNTATTIFNAVKNAMTRPIISARDTIKKVIDRIKGFFSGLKLKFPKISMPKLPRFSLTGKFSLMPPSVPKVGIKWNADGGVFSRPTIFNTSNAGMQGVGEAGPEAILPLNSRVLGGIGQGIARTMNVNETRESPPNTGTINRGDIVFNVDGYELARIQQPHLDDMFGESVDLTNYMKGVR